MSRDLKIYRKVSIWKLYLFPLMVLTFTLLSLCSATIIFAQQQRADINLRNVSVKQLIDEIKVKYNYDFVYSDIGLETIPKKDVNIKQATVQEVLNSFFKATNLEYEITNRTIVLKRITKSNPIEKILTGKILDAQGNPLPGVTILIKESNKGTISEPDGTFQLKVAEDSLILVFSHIGMKRVERKCFIGVPVTIVMVQEETLIKDLVFVGYFTADRSTYTGSATTIKKDEIEKISATNIFSVIQSIEPSFRIIEDNSQGSNPNALPDFEIRGKSSIGELESEYRTNPNQPLFILDGFETNVEKVFDLDPNLVESITILKDATATAIYGSRAMNGIVVIETIKPTRGKLKLSYSFNGRVEIPDLSSYNLCNASEKLEVEKLAGLFEDWSEEENIKRRNVLSGINTDWIAQPLNKAAFSQQHSFRLSGGDNVFQYGANLNLNPTSGVMINSTRNRNSVDLFLNYRSKDFTFKLQSSNDYIISNNSDYGTFSKYTLLNPYYRMRDDNGDYTYVLEFFRAGLFISEYITNPLSNTRFKNIDRMSYTSSRQDAEISYTFLKNFRLRASGSVTIKKSDTQLFKPETHTDFYEEAIAYRVDPSGSYYYGGDKSFIYQGNLSLNHNWSFKNGHLISTNIAGTILSSNMYQFGFETVGFTNDDLHDISFASGYSSSRKAQGINSISRSAGLFLTSNYSYQNRYFTDISFRTDASSKFGANRRWAPFWSIGAGWNLHNEKFLKGVKEISRIKLRFSYGIVGSQNFNPYQSIPTYQYMYDQYMYRSYGALLKAMGNPDLKWQAATKLNIGLESAFFNNWISLRFDFYRGVSRNLLIDMNLPMSSGFYSYKSNLGSVLNKGYEFNFLTYLAKKEKTNISISVNGSHNEDKLLKLAETVLAWNEVQDQIESNQIRVRYIPGQSINTIWVVRSLGIDPATGNEVFLDLDGNKTFDWSPLNYYPYKNREPIVFGNISLNLYHKGLSLNFYGNYSLGGYEYNQTLVSKVENADKRLNVDRRMFTESWKQPGDLTFFRSLEIKGITRPTSRFVQKNDFLNMTSLNVGYQIQNNKFLKNLKMEFLKFTLYMNDIFYISTIKRERGLSYPYSRTISLSIQTRF